VGNYLLSSLNGLTYQNHYTYLWLYAAVCAPEDGCKYQPKHVELKIENNKEHIYLVGPTIEHIHYQDVRNHEHQMDTEVIHETLASTYYIEQVYLHTRPHSNFFGAV
jgi:hypothetical protein